MSPDLCGIGQQTGYPRLRHFNSRTHLFIHGQELLGENAIDTTSGETDSTRGVASVYPIPVTGAGGLKGLDGEPLDGLTIVGRG